MPMLPIDIDEKDRMAIIAPHPDDEVIGAGGLLARYPSQCTVILMTDGSCGDEKMAPALLRDRRYAEFRSVMDELEVKYVCLDYEDGTLLGVPECFDKIDFTGFTKVFLPCMEDDHPDHMAACQYAQKRMREQKTDDVEIYQYEVHLPFHWTTHYIDISDVVEQKVQMIAAYRSQMHIHDYPDQVRSLAHFRGCQNNATGRYLEAYLQTPLSSDLEEGKFLEQERRLEKAVQLNRLLGKWTDLSICRVNLGDYFTGSGRKRIAVYGWGSVGKKVYKELLMCGVEVPYVLDKSVLRSGIDGLEVHPPCNNDVSVDAVLVTVLGCGEEMIHLLEALGYKDILLLDKLLDELLFRSNYKTGSRNPDR